MSLRTPVYRSLVADGAVTAIAGTRIYPGALPQSVTLPAIVLTTVSGAPENYLSQRPGIDNYRVQIDVWAKDEPEANDLASKVRANVEQIGQIVSYNGEEFEPTTKRYRYSFDLSVFVHR